MTSIELDGDDAVIRFPADQIHSVRVALAPRLAGETPATKTQAIRDWLDKGLAKLQG